MIDIERVATKLAEVRSRDRGLKLFGASSHRYVLNPTVDEKTLAAFEGRHALTLPEDYRLFLHRLGNGGAGPFYGVFRLGETDDNFDHAPWREGEGMVGKLNVPFPHRAEWNLPAEELAPPDSFESDEEEQRWQEGIDKRYWNTALVNGALPICHHGCALRTWIVVTGAERGNVWYDGRAEGGGLRPHLDEDGAHLSFGAWYEGWLDQSLTELDGRNGARRRAPRRAR